MKLAAPVIAKDALILAAKGWSVFPCKPDKSPLVNNGFHDATTHEATIIRWWERVWPGANIGIRTGAESGILALDIDADHGGDDTLHELERVHGDLPRTVECLTGGGGRHIYFRHPGTEIRNSAGRLGGGLDVRGDGGYVIAPPSVHQNGRQYVWSVDGNPDEVEVADMPNWLLGMLHAPASSSNGKVPQEPISEGSRNQGLTSIAGRLRREGMSEGGMIAALIAINQERCEPPLGEPEVRAIAKSVGRYAPAQRDYAIKIDDKGNLTLPAVPVLEDVVGHCGWLTAAFALDPTHPITRGQRQGQRGPEGHVVLFRAGAEPIRFEPATRINAPMRMIETLSWQTLPSDGAPLPYKGVHCQKIAHVVKMLCGISENLTEVQEAEGIVCTFMAYATPIEGASTYGPTQERYAAAIALRRRVDEATGREIGHAHYLIDGQTGELVIGVSDLGDAARRHVGSSLPRGWLDARMEAIGWRRVPLQGYERSGRSRGRHARINAYRGHLPEIPADDEQVNT